MILSAGLLPGVGILCLINAHPAAALVPLFLVSDLLPVNQFPDRQADRWAGRNHPLLAPGIAPG